MTQDDDLVTVEFATTSIHN